MEAATKSFRRLGLAWLFLTVALCLHVLDEATTGFLAIYNPTVVIVQERWSWFPMPTFGFREWLAGLIFFCIVLFLIAPLFFRGGRLLRIPAAIFAGLMILNGCGHILVTILGRTVANISVPRPAPGFWSSPLLIGASAWFLVELARSRPSHPRLRSTGAWSSRF